MQVNNTKYLVKFKMDIYSNIKKIRNTLKLSQTVFAKNMGMTMQGIQNWEAGKGKIRDASINLICQTYNVNPEWLREGEGEMFLNDGQEVSSLANEIILKIGKLDNDKLQRLAGYIDSLQPLDKTSKKSRGGE